MLKKIAFFFICVLIPFSLQASDSGLIEKTADHICNICSSKNKSRLAIYTFTDQSDKETDETKKYTTKIISVIISCQDIKVIDPSKVQAVMDEQAKSMLGIVDDETAPETGKLLGADAPRPRVELLHEIGRLVVGVDVDEIFFFPFFSFNYSHNITVTITKYLNLSFLLNL